MPVKVHVQDQGVKTQQENLSEGCAEGETRPAGTFLKSWCPAMAMFCACAGCWQPTEGWKVGRYVYVYAG